MRDNPDLDSVLGGVEPVNSARLPKRITRILRHSPPSLVKRPATGRLRLFRAWGQAFCETGALAVLNRYPTAHSVLHTLKDVEPVVTSRLGGEIHRPRSPYFYCNRSTHRAPPGVAGIAWWSCTSGRCVPLHCGVAPG